MCGGVIYHYNSKIIKTYFPNPKAALPIKLKQGGIKLLPWGRRQQQSGHLPLGGWARLESIQKGIWDKYFPKSVKIMVSEFMEKDQATGMSEWFSVNEGQFIQGLVAHDDQEQRVYVVTIPPPQKEAIHNRWPRILTDNDSKIYGFGVG